jgi:hypothetical protein
MPDHDRPEPESTQPEHRLEPGTPSQGPRSPRPAAQPPGHTPASGGGAAGTTGEGDAAGSAEVDQDAVLDELLAAESRELPIGWWAGGWRSARRLARIWPRGWRLSGAGAGGRRAGRGGGVVAAAGRLGAGGRAGHGRSDRFPVGSTGREDRRRRAGPPGPRRRRRTFDDVDGVRGWQPPCWLVF